MALPAEPLPFETSTLICTVRVDGAVYDAEVALPPGPRCRVCKHELCPHCRDWCDTVDADAEICDCFPRCSLDRAEADAWLAEVDRRIALACFGGRGALFVL